LSLASADVASGTVLLRGRKGQRSGDISPVLRTIRRVTIPIVDHDFTEIEGRNPFKARDIDPKLVGIRASFVVSVDAATAAEMMFGGLCIEPIGREFVRALPQFEILRR